MSTVATVIPAEGAVLERALDTAHSIAPDGLSRQAYARFHAAQIKTAWGRRHQRRLALIQDGATLASATQYDLTAILDGRPVRVLAGCQRNARVPRRRRSAVSVA